MSIHKGGHFKQYIHNTPWYLLSSIFTKLMGFILLPVYARFFSQEDIGALATYESMGRILVVIISLFLDSAFISYYYNVKSNSANELTVFFSTHFWFVLIWGAGASVLLTFFIPLISLELPPSGYWLMPSLVTSLLFGQIVTLFTSIWSANLIVKKIAIFNVFFSLLSLIITLLLILNFDGDWQSRVYTLLVISTIQIVLIIILSINNGLLKFRFSWKVISTSLRYSTPLMPNIIAGWVALFSDRLILSYYGKLDQVGIYSIAAQFALILYIVNDSVTKIQGPLALSGMTDNVVFAKREMSNFIQIYIPVMFMLYFCILAILPDVLVFFLGTNYADVNSIFILLGWIYILSGVYRVFTHVISFYNKTWMISFGAIFQALLNVFLNFIFIPIYGMYAAALSTVISVFLYTFLLALFSQSLDKIDLNYRKISLCFLFGVLGGGAFYILDIQSISSLIKMALKISLVIVMSFLFFMTLTVEVQTSIKKTLRFSIK